ncbi:MAG TPA: DegT/DnrJ/EryC1/StrS family aminotransferase [Acidobacteriota bacterium]|jgi:dTDP-4-amino-4,6-dideoxygalactose transaminase
MKRKNLSRRQFLATSTGATVLAALPPAKTAPLVRNTNAATPALLGGAPVRTKPFPRWPIWTDADEQAILPVLRSGIWSRANIVAEAEKKFARLMGAEHCLLTTNGTNALITSIYGLGIGAGQEVITTPYTFIATIHAILMNNALPVFADIDPDTWQMEPGKIEEKITKNTAAILPVHILGGVCDMDRINAIARKHNLRVIEDACESHLAEWKGKKVGTLGDLGCLSFQNGKALTCGEGGAILGRDERTMDLCYSFHNLGRPKGKYMPRDRGGHPIAASKCRMAEYQASILMTQMESVVEQTRRRAENAKYFTAKLREIPGIVPRKDYPDVTQLGFYYYGFRYKKEAFDGLPRDHFLQAVHAEGVSMSKGLGVIEGFPMNREGAVLSSLDSKIFRSVYPKETLDSYRDRNHCPKSDDLVEETVGFHQRYLLGTKEDMDDIYNAILKIYENRKKLSSAPLGGR